jgi:hypothetical protein
LLRVFITYNTEECDWGKGDCIEFNKAYPDCKVQFPELVGNGLCSGGEYDVEPCVWMGWWRLQIVIIGVS